MSVSIGRSSGAGIDGVNAGVARAVFVAMLLAALAEGALWPDRAASGQAIAVAGPSLTRLLRAMAAIKMLIAGMAGAAVYWRLGSPVGVVRFGAYLAAGGAMAAGPGLIWAMSHVGAGALLLHGGLLATILLLWRDPGMAVRLDAAIASRRRALAKA
jgi:hypothetical protein